VPFVVEHFTLDTPQKAFLFLMRTFNITQKEAQRLIARGRLFVDEVPMTHTAGVVQGSFKVVRFVPDTQNNPPIFRNDDFAVFEKPSGILVHPSNRHTPYSLIDEVKFHLGANANITHRIDQETSGLVLASCHKESEIALKGAFEHRQIKKEYLALVRGRIDEPMLIDEPIDRHPDQEAIVKVMMRVDAAGKVSQTYIAPLKYFPHLNMTMVSANPKTGRQHQIRVHLAHIGHAIVGDPLYGIPLDIAARFLERELSPQERLHYTKASRLLLHANRLYFHYNEARFDIASTADFEAECYAALALSSTTPPT